MSCSAKGPQLCTVVGLLCALTGGCEPDPCKKNGVGPNGCLDGAFAYSDPETRLNIRTTANTVDAGFASESAVECTSDLWSGYGWDGHDLFCEHEQFPGGPADKQGGLTTTTYTLTDIPSEADLVGRSFAEATAWQCTGCYGGADMGEDCPADEAVLTGAVTIAEIDGDVVRLDVDLDGLTGVLWGFVCRYDAEEDE